ncbi:MAG: hypothetical protein H6622_05120 [Halobacteriovoraceae bacterium]|nr:hypothetical protein [Halobacteriovoraceae bacterium]
MRDNKYWAVLFILILNFSNCFAVNSGDNSTSIDTPTYLNESYRATGVMIGRFDDISPEDGWIIKTPEVYINVGELKDEGRFSFKGKVEHFSVAQEIDGIVKKLLDAPSSKPYVFHFVHKSWYDLEIENSKVQIVDAYPIKTRSELNLPIEMVEHLMNKENLTTISGKIIKAERRSSDWVGSLDVDCQIVVSQGFENRDMRDLQQGLKDRIRQKNDSNDRKQILKTLGIYGENMCTYAHDVAKTGATLEIEYYEYKDRMINWDKNNFVAHRIRILEGNDLINKFYKHKLDTQIVDLINGMNNNASNSNNFNNSSNSMVMNSGNNMNYEIIARYVEDRLLSNREFLNSLKDIMDQMYEEEARLKIRK